MDTVDLSREAKELYAQELANLRYDAMERQILGGGFRFAAWACAIAIALSLLLIVLMAVGF